MRKGEISEFLDIKKLKEILQNIKKKRILVVGDIFLDRFIWGDVSRISPEAPVPVVEVRNESFTAGGAGNVAFNIKSLGGNVILIAGIGKDTNGEILSKLVKKNGVETFFLERECPTITKTRIIGINQQIVRIDREIKIKLSNKEERKIIDKIGEIIDKIDGIIISDYGKGIITKKLISFLIEIKKKKGIVLCIDPKLEHFTYYKNVTCLTPNKKEAAEGMKTSVSESKDDIMKLGNKIKKKLKCENLIITLGKDGMMLFNTKNEIVYIPSVAKEVYDVTGAGDTVIASFTLSYVETKNEIVSSIISNLAGGIVVGKLGTAVVSDKELEKFFEENSNSPIFTE